MNQNELKRRQEDVPDLQQELADEQVVTSNLQREIEHQQEEVFNLQLELKGQRDVMSNLRWELEGERNAMSKLLQNTKRCQKETNELKQKNRKLCGVLSLNLTVLAAAVLLQLCSTYYSTTSLPKELEPIRKVSVRDWSFNIAELGTQVFVGVYGGVDVVVGNNYSSEQFINLNGDVFGLRGYKDHLYLINCKYNNNRWTCWLRVFDQTGTQRTFWSVHESARYLAVHDDLIYVPEQDNDRIAVYTLTGQTDRYMRRNLSGPYSPHIHVIPDSRVVITTGPHTVSCTSIISGQTLWTSSTLVTPHAITTNSRGLIFISTGGATEDIQTAVLSPDTGNK